MGQIAIDIGNTRIKCASFEEEKFIQEISISDLDDLIYKSQNWIGKSLVISSVKYSQSELSEKLAVDFLYLSTSTPLPILNLYATPETLGVDRKAAVIGAMSLYPNRPVLAIDCGTCITYDYLDEKGQYHGGSISPGLQMRFKAMNQQTARLPLVTLEEGKIPDLTGNSTLIGMQSGVYWGIYFEINSVIASYQEKQPDLMVLICGGDSKTFESLTKDYIFVIPNLVLYGLNRILSYNVNLS